MHYRNFLRLRLFLVLILALFCASHLRAQCYEFTNFNLKEGLSQSQVATIFQAKDRTLWLGTYGGLNNFDGKEFISYGKADGLVSNNITSIVEDHQGRILVGSDRGIDAIKNGVVQNLTAGFPIFQLVKDRKGMVWGIGGRRFFKLVNNRVEFITIDGFNLSKLVLNKRGELFAVASGKGIFHQVNGIWSSFISFPEELSEVHIMDLVFDKDDPNKVYLATWDGRVYVYDGNTFNLLFKKDQARCFTIEQDEKSNIWVGLDHGAVLIKKEETIFLNARNGLSDNRVQDIFKDAENNIWISSLTNGIFKYEGDHYIRYNKFKDVDLSYIVSGIAADRSGSLLVGTMNKGLIKYDGKRVEILQNPGFAGKMIYFVYTDPQQNIWFSVHDSGIWKTDGKKFELVYPINKARSKSNYNSMYRNADGKIWFTDFISVTHVDKGKKTSMHRFSGYQSSLFGIAKDSVLVGTTGGLHLVKNDRIDEKFVIPALKDAHILCINKMGQTIIIGTLGDGILTYHLKTKEVKQYTTNNGLNSNDVYSLAFDKLKQLWVGTGRGINTFVFNKSKNSFQALNTHAPIMECNQNAIFNYKDFVFIGTIDGLVRCKTKGIAQIKQQPLIQINKINIFHKEDHSQDTSVVQTGSPSVELKLNHNQNNVTINYKAIYLSNPKGITYRYMLRGLDTEFGKSLKNTQVEYYALQPGGYTFLVYAMVNGQKSNVSEVSFTIVPPFYQTLSFRLALAFVVLSIIGISFYVYFKTKERKQQQLEQIKQEEQKKIRKQTSEDFHDDIGNKLTRINVLSEILAKKMNTDQTEQKALIKMIQENASLLYNGTKDILWALNPQSGNLYEILIYIRDFGIDLFQNTGIKFEMEGIIDEYRKIYLPMEFNRNFTLIFKEILNNILKHAGAEEVLVMAVKNQYGMLDVLVIDNGVGFDLEKVAKGSGLTNIKNRCSRIKSVMEINSRIGKGTTLMISTKIDVTN